MNGIICLEREWEHTVKSNRLSLHTKSMLDFLEKSWNCKVIYRRVATKSELQYYLTRFRNAEYKDYSIFYLSFHGDTHSIQLEGENKNENKISLSDLAEMSNGTFTDKFVHFSSCRTFLGSNKELEHFKEETGATSISGYTKSVDCILSVINDLSYFDQIFRHKTKKTYLASAMDKYYGGLGKELGFRIL